MIHYSCDLCGSRLNPSDQRYVVKMDLYEAVSTSPHDDDSEDVDQLEALSDMLEQLDDDFEVSDESCSQEFRFDLCPECRKRFAKDPLGRESLLKQLDFSSN